MTGRKEREGINDVSMKRSQGRDDEGTREGRDVAAGEVTI